MDRERYEKVLSGLHVELAKLEYWVRLNGKRVVVVFEGRDAAGKGGTITALCAGMNPRTVRTVALPKPSPRESTQWYFQRYVEQLPAAGEIVLFDRSWYNRAGVEPVMGFCTPEQHQKFLRECPKFEQLLTDDDILLRKYYLSVSQEEQHRRFAARSANPTKRWKLSDVDIQAIAKFDEYTAAKDEMFASTHTSANPWYVVDSNSKREARLDVITHLLSTFDYQDSEPPTRDIPALPTERVRDRDRQPKQRSSHRNGPTRVGTGPR